MFGPEAAPHFTVWENVTLVEKFLDIYWYICSQLL